MLRTCCHVFACASLIGLAAAQGGLRWSSPNRRPVLSVRQNASTTAPYFNWTISIDGWSTSAAIPIAGGDEGVAVGIDSAVYGVRATTSDFIRGGTGGVASLVPWLSFAPDFRLVGSLVGNGTSGRLWAGFRGTVTQQLPDNDFGSLAIRLEDMFVNDAATMLTVLPQTRLEVATVDAAGTPIGTQYSLPRAGVPWVVRMAEIVHYTFDRGDGDFAVNVAGVDGGAAGMANLSRTSGSPWTAGRFGNALAAGTTCDTGFFGDLGGRLTVAFFLRGMPATSTTPLFRLGSFGAAMLPNGRIRCSGFGAPAQVDSPVIPAGRFVHVALVLDMERGQGGWFVDGVLGNSFALTSFAIPPSTTPLTIGDRACPYHIDEFRMAAEAVAVPRIAAWAAGSEGGAQAFGTACGANLQHSGPATRGAIMTYHVEAAPNSAVALFLGFGQVFSGQRLPLDLGLLRSDLAGCQLYCDLAIALPLHFAAGRIHDIPLPIPVNAALAHIELHNQAFAMDQQGALRATNPHALSLD